MLMKLKTNLLLLVSLLVSGLSWFGAPIVALSPARPDFANASSDKPELESPVRHSLGDGGRDVAGTGLSQDSQGLQAKLAQLEEQLYQLQRQVDSPYQKLKVQRPQQNPHPLFTNPANSAPSDHADQTTTANFIRERQTNYTVPLANDYTLNFFGNLQIDFFTGTALELFSADDLDNYMFMQDALDIGFNINKPHGDARYQLVADLRTKGVFGNSGIFDQTVPKAIKIGLGRTESDYSFKPNLQNVWLRELWFKYNINPAYHSDFQIGCFPFSIGAGLSLGNAYKVGKLIPGYYEERFVDQFRPGILLSGDIWNDRLFYSLYAGITINEGSNFWDTGAFSNAQDPNMRTHPSRGRFVKDVIAAAEISYRTQYGAIDCDVRPYLVIDHDQAQQVEFPDDATSFLGILGLNFQATQGHWSLFFESAMNFGSQYVKSWDRDFVQFVSGPQHTYLFQDFSDKPGIDTPVWKVARRTPCPEDASFYRGNGTEFWDATEYHYKNAFDRFRQGYSNTYHGVMVYAETAYRHAHPFKLDTELTIAFGAGFASGDTPPNDTAENLLANRLNGSCDICDKGDCHAYVPFSDFNKDYCGFVGVGQMFINRDVYSVFLLESEKLNQPLSARDNRLTYPQFSNLMFVGLGTTYEQSITNERSFKIRFNLLSYWQPWQSLKGYNYGLDTLFALSSCGQIATETYAPGLTADANTQLGHHLGVEVNSTLNYKFDDHLDLYIAAAAFLPGTYYDAAYGKIIPLAAQYQLANVDFSGYEMNPNKYDIALGDNTAFILNIGFGYSFDTAPKTRAVFTPAFQQQVQQLDPSAPPLRPMPLATPRAPHVITVPTPTAKLSEQELLLLNVLEAPVSDPQHQPDRRALAPALTQPIALVTPAAANTAVDRSGNPDILILSPVMINTSQHVADIQSQLQLLSHQTLAVRRTALVVPSATPIDESISTVVMSTLPKNTLQNVVNLRQQLQILNHQPVAVTHIALITPPATPIFDSNVGLGQLPTAVASADQQLLNSLAYQVPTVRPLRLTVQQQPAALVLPTPALPWQSAVVTVATPADLAVLEQDFTPHTADSLRVLNQPTQLVVPAVNIATAPVALTNNPAELTNALATLETDFAAPISLKLALKNTGTDSLIGLT